MKHIAWDISEDLLFQIVILLFIGRDNKQEA